MNKNTVLAIGLSALVILAFQVFFAPKPTVQNQVQQSAQTEDNKGQIVPVEDAQPITIEEQTAQTEPMILETFDVLTDNVRYVFNANTGNIREAVINSYHSRDLTNVGFKSVNGDVVFADVPFISAYTSDVQKTNGTTTVTFSGSQGDIVVTKKYVINDDSYLVKGELVLNNTGDRTVNVPLTSGIGANAVDGFESDRYSFQGPLMFDGKRLKKEKAEKVDKSIVVDHPKWVGYMSKYFMIGVAQDYSKGTISPAGGSAKITGSADMKLNPDARETVEFSLFAGPKEYDLLKSYDLKLEKSIDFGIFSFIAIPMLKFLKIIYSYVHNYGVAIILLTLVIKILTFPLTQKSMVSMKKMSSLQPKMLEIKEKFKGDKEKTNAATMELYKNEGVNPLGGCLPMVLQIPIFFALYKTLLLAIELQGAPFMLWITDLSLKDPYYISPILMGASMFLQQKMTPSTAQDPLQQKIFTFMPLIFTFLFLTFPAGLVVYWLTNNVLSIAQQYFINKKLA
ncbi:membrane protein insertase, YidC/Oxa1 family [Denitrovibrio acetiphilus DSM 12809]|uniref:Membrane protein insertase YidC n=1 Tax=Denitrovibrio acetiphilus (strain DSM 12809 / NBRC 114555 / N2460) TaxID=522772 RepID=D4H194_DENA2|nr:membrane protein insertase YidC [Denitrovibrio acetiphilus]ADD66842.1 membrane protein insertase, YidC/Oxa1 family [Denitrovibrio acetiphilus DSM 12809]